MRLSTISALSITLAVALAAVGISQSVSARVITPDCGPNNVRCMEGYDPVCANDGTWQCSSSAVDCGPSYVRCGSGYEPVCKDDGKWACQQNDSESACGPNNVRCMEGYDPICGDNGRWQCQPQPSGCDASAILCMQGTMPQCSDGEWRCVPQSSSSSASSCPNVEVLCMTGTAAACQDGSWECLPTPDACADADPIYCFQGAPICRDGSWHCPSTVGPLQLDRLSPDSGRAGQRVVISGQSFTRTGNTVYFDGSVLENLRSRQRGTKLVFRVPAKTTLPCLPFCKIAVLPYGPGEYDVSVENKDGAVSNSLTFTITGSSSSSKSSSSSSSSIADSCLCPAGQAATENGCTEMEMMCPMYYLEGGWCGCDGEVYGNSCIAAANGVKSGAPCLQ